jgi:hypothetical protein
VADALDKSGGICSVAAKKLKCDARTVRNYIARHETLKSLVDEIVETTIDTAETQLHKAIRDGNMTAIIFYLKTKGKDRGYSERREVTGADGDAVRVEHTAPIILLPPESDD